MIKTSREQLKGLYVEGGLSIASTASLLGVCWQTVRRGLLRERLPIRRPGGSLPGHASRTPDVMREYQAANMG
jgi:hypothetical protein